MAHHHANVLNPVGAVRARAPAGGAKKRSRGRSVIGLLNNSKPNVAIFLEAIQETLRASGDYDIVSVTKPRSAGPSPDLDTLARRCDFVINAVGD